MQSVMNFEEEWSAYQIENSKKLVLVDEHDWDINTLKYVGGLDITFSTVQPDVALGCLVVCEFPSCKEVKRYLLKETVKIPYISTFLGFREVGTYKRLLEKCKKEDPEIYPQVVLVDGNGTYHPRRFGSACQVGFELNICAIGVSKSILHVDDIDKTKIKDMMNSMNNGEFKNVINGEGEVLCSIHKSEHGSNNPIFISQGNKVSLETAIEVTKACLICKIPEPIRLADKVSRSMLKKEGLLK